MLSGEGYVTCAIGPPRSSSGCFGALVVDVDPDPILLQVGVRLELPVDLVPPRREEGVAEDDVPNFACRWFVEHVDVDEEEDGHVDFFARQQPLLLEAETFDFGEEWCDPVWRDIVGSNANDVLRPVVLCREEGQRCLAGEHIDLLLSRRERPRQRIARIRIERHPNPPSRRSSRGVMRSREEPRWIKASVSSAAAASVRG